MGEIHATIFTAVVDGGFMHVTSDGDATRVDVLAANAQMREEIDVEDARRRASELEDRLRERDTADAEADLAGVEESSSGPRPGSTWAG